MKTESQALVRVRDFLVVWRNPSTREFVHVGDLRIEHAGADVHRCRFAYASDLLATREFEPFLAFPHLDRSYEQAGSLFPFFANRVMSARRPDFAQYAEALGLDVDQADPVEILARSTGERATDTVHVVPQPTILEDGTERRLFFVSGIRHTPDAEARVLELNEHDPLQLRQEPTNESNPRAVLVDADHDQPVGWVPNYLLDYLHKRWEEGYQAYAFVEHANGPGVPWHLRLLCRMDLRPPGR